MDKPTVADVYKVHDSSTVSLFADSSIEDAVGTLARNPSFQGIFLVDINQKYVDMITRLDLIRWAHLNLTGGKGGHNIPISEYLRILGARKARDLASGNQEVLVVKENNTLQVALEKMLNYEEDLLPVLDSEDRVLGDLRLSEVLSYVLALCRQDDQD